MNKKIIVPYRAGLLDGEACNFSMEAEVENSNIVNGYLDNYLMYAVFKGTNKTLVDEETGLIFSIAVEENDFSILKTSENKNNIGKLLQKIGI